MARCATLGLVSLALLAIGACTVGDLPKDAATKDGAVSGGSGGDAAVGGSGGPSGSGGSSDDSAVGGTGGDAESDASEAGTGGAAGTGGTSDAGSDASCVSPLVSCGSSCVDTSTDAQHCGTCDHDCLGATCTGGSCAPEPVDQTGVQYYWLALDNGTLYYQRGAQICARSTASGSSCQVLMSGTGYGAHIATNATNVYVNESLNLWRVAKTGGTAQKLDNPVYGLTADDAYVYYLLAGPGFVRLNQDGSGTAFPLGTPSLPNQDFFCQIMATDGDYLYYFAYHTGDVWRVSINGSNPSSYSFGPPYVWGATVSGGYVYWTPSSGPRRVSVSGGDPEDLTPSTPQILCNSPVVVGNFLFWADRGDDQLVESRVWRRNLQTGETIMLADKLDHVQGVAADAQYVYFTVMGMASPSNGGVFKVGR